MRSSISSKMHLLVAKRVAMRTREEDEVERHGLEHDRVFVAEGEEGEDAEDGDDGGAAEQQQRVDRLDDGLAEAVAEDDEGSIHAGSIL